LGIPWVLGGDLQKKKRNWFLFITMVSKKSTSQKALTCITSSLELFQNPQIAGSFILNF